MTSQASTNPGMHLAFFMASLAHGGIGKMRVHLTRELVNRGIKVDLLLGKTDSPYLPAIDSRIRVIRIGTSDAIRSLPRLVYYLRRERPFALITERIRVNVAALRARRIAHVNTLVFAGVHTTMSRELENLRPEKQRSHSAFMRRYYPKNDGFIAISKGVAEDIAKAIRVPAEKIWVVYNPVITPELLRQAQVPADHPWVAPGALPLILGAGRLEPQKDFPTLIRAFAKVRKQRACRLMILGEGKERSRLEALAAELNVLEDLSLPGFLTNPHALMAKAALFVLSSAWEGFGNVLVEALALGIPAVATSCESGPEEILQGGRYGPLVPVGNVDAMAEAMQATMDNPLSKDILQSAVKHYTAGACADGYLEVLNLHRSQALADTGSA
jgi:glycosyltransferase involved in cell wall biosynthesis